MPSSYVLTCVNDLMVYGTQPMKGLAIGPQAVFADNNQLDVMAVDAGSYIKAGAWGPKWKTDPGRPGGPYWVDAQRPVPRCR